MSRELDLIYAIESSFKDSIDYFTNGECYAFYNILKAAFPEAEAYYDSNHVITKIGDKFYDITGEVKKDRHIPIMQYYPNLMDKNDKLKTFI